MICDNRNKLCGGHRDAAAVTRVTSDLSENDDDDDYDDDGTLADKSASSFSSTSFKVNRPALSDAVHRRHQQQVSATEAPVVLSHYCERSRVALVCQAIACMGSFLIGSRTEISILPFESSP